MLDKEQFFKVVNSAVAEAKSNNKFRFAINTSDVSQEIIDETVINLAKNGFFIKKGIVAPILIIGFEPWKPIVNNT